MIVKNDDIKIDLVSFLIINLMIIEKNKIVGIVIMRGRSKSVKINSFEFSLYIKIIK